MRSRLPVARPYFLAGVERTFLSSISLLAALFFSALSWALGGVPALPPDWGLRGRETGSVAVLSPAAEASTSTVATLQSPPPTISDSFFFFPVAANSGYSAALSLGSVGPGLLLAKLVQAPHGCGQWTGMLGGLDPRFLRCSRL
jgi:hypothetical protein